MQALRSFNGAADAQLSLLQPDDLLNATKLVEALALSLRLVASLRGTTSIDPVSMHEATSSRTSSSNVQSLRLKAQAVVSFGKHKYHIVYHAFCDVNYRDWCLKNTTANSSRELKALCNLFGEIAHYEQRNGKLLDYPASSETRHGYMAIDVTASAGSEKDLVAILDTGCNTTCHGSKWLSTYLQATEQSAPALEADGGGGFKGIGGVTATSGARLLELCLELHDGTLARGKLKSVEISNSDAPLLLSLEAQRQLGLVLDLNEGVAHSTTLGGDLKLIHHNGLLGLRLLPGAFAGMSHAVHGGAEPEDVDDHSLDLRVDPTILDAHSADEPDEPEAVVGYLAFDQLPVHAMSKQQAGRVKEHVDTVTKKDKLLWNQVCPRHLRRRPCLPHGCKTLLMEIFAGCAMLTAVAHRDYGYPISEPIDIAFDQSYDLTTASGRAAVDARILHDDPYLLAFAPVCGPWSPWSRLNMSRSPETCAKIQAERKRWLPVAKWICEHARQRLQRGRQVLVENPGPSELWETSYFDRLLHREDHYDQLTLERLEKIEADLCAYNLRDRDSGLLHKKRTGLLTSSPHLKLAVEHSGQCTGDHPHEPLEGGGRCKRAQAWTHEFCTQVVESHLHDLDQHLTRAAFPAEAMAEDEHSTDNPLLAAAFDKIHGEEDYALPGVGEPASPEELERTVPSLEELENSQLAQFRAEWRKLPMASRVAVRRLHSMTGHASVSSMQRLLRTAGGDPKVIHALKYFRCPACEERKEPAPRPKTRPPSEYRFNVEVALDCFEAKDCQGNRFTVLSMVDMGTLYHVATIVAPQGVPPGSQACADAFQRTWLSWAGPPQSIVVDRGLHNRGRFAQLMSFHGIQIRFIGVEAHHQLGRGERQGHILKQIIHHAVESRQLVGLHAFELLLPECVFVKNNRLHHGGFTPSQWTLGRLPLEVDALTSEDAGRYLGSHQEILPRLPGRCNFARLPRKLLPLLMHPRDCGRPCYGSPHPHGARFFPVTLSVSFGKGVPSMDVGLDLPECSDKRDALRSG